ASADNVHPQEAQPHVAVEPAQHTAPRHAACHTLFTLLIDGHRMAALPKRGTAVFGLPLLRKRRPLTMRLSVAARGYLLASVNRFAANHSDSKPTHARIHMK